MGAYGDEVQIKAKLAPTRERRRINLPKRMETAKSAKEQNGFVATKRRLTSV
jgi:hypothetical protein